MLLGATGRPLTPSVRPSSSTRVDPMTDLDGLESAAEGLVEGALDQPLEPPLEPLESHAESVPSSPSDEAAPAPNPNIRRCPWYMGVK